MFMWKIIENSITTSVYHILGNKTQGQDVKEPEFKYHRARLCLCLTEYYKLTFFSIGFDF